MELTGNPFWKMYYGEEMPKITTFLNEAQTFVSTHDVTSIKFYVSIMLTEPGIGGREREFNEREMTKEELLSLNQKWVEQTMEETAEIAAKHWGLPDN